MKNLTEPVPEEEYKLLNKEALMNHEIRIEFLDRGCVIRIGCKAIAFEDVEEAMVALVNYTKNPWESQQEWRKILN
jgi:hypothetical protein